MIIRSLFEFYDFQIEESEEPLQAAVPEISDDGSDDYTKSPPKKVESQEQEISLPDLDQKC